MRETSFIGLPIMAGADLTAFLTFTDPGGLLFMWRAGLGAI
jgi:hypothetical protein